MRARGAAWLAHWTVNPEVAGSNPVEPAILPRGYDALGEGALRNEAPDSPISLRDTRCGWPDPRHGAPRRLRANVVARALHRLAKIVLGRDVVAVEDRARPVARDLHRHPIPDSPAPHVAPPPATPVGTAPGSGSASRSRPR